MSPLHRAFTLWPDRGDPLHVNRACQGGGRHDNPERYAALYASRSPQSAVAETLRRFRGRLIGGTALGRADGGRLALATIDDTELGDVVDLDEPRGLDARSLRPSSVATGEREVTQPIALRVYEEGADGLAWWSPVEASWINVTLFIDRVVPKLTLADEPRMLTAEDPVVRAAAQAVGVRLS